MVSASFADRPLKKLCLFDVDGTLTPARQTASPEMIETLRALRKKLVIGFVGGSDLKKIREQLQTGTEDGMDVLFLRRIGANLSRGSVIHEFDYSFAENGLTAYKLGKELPSHSFIGFLGEDRYKLLIKFVLHYLADMDIPIKRGTFVEYRNGMVNISPIGRNASTQERNDFEVLDLKNGWRATMVQALKDKFPDFPLTYSIGGQISFDVFPHGWDKTFSLGRVEDEQFEEIHFFGDKTYKGGNDYEIYSDPRTIGHSVKSPTDTIRILQELFLKD